MWDYIWVGCLWEQCKGRPEGEKNDENAMNENQEDFV